MIKRLLLVIILFSLNTIVLGQTNDIRGFYLQDVGDWLGNTTEENNILTYAQGNGFNYILFYDLGDINWNSSTEKNQLANFINKARTQYGIVQIGGVVEYAGYASDKLIPYNNSRSSSLDKFDVINLEFEFWIPSSISYYCNKFLSSAGFPCTQAGMWNFAWREFKAIDDICANNGMVSEIYIGWPSASQIQQLASRADRILLSAYRPTDSDIYVYSEQRMRDIGIIGGVTKILTLMSAEPDFMGPWLNSHSQAQPYQTMESGLISETESFKQHINLIGYQWFTYKYLPHTIPPNPCIPPSIPNVTGSLLVSPGQTTTLTSTINLGYLWSNGETTQSVEVGSGTYTVRGYSGSNCFTTSDPVIVTELTTDISQYSVIKDVISVFPNPSDSKITVKCDFGDNISIFNINGVKKYSNKFKGEIIINVSDFPNGMYFIQIDNNTTNYHIKFIKN